MPTKIKYLILCLIWFFPKWISAQGNINFSHYNTDNGLSQGTVHDMAFDKDGFLWIGTQDGLNRYDGYKFVNFKHNPNDASSFPQPTVTSILPNSTGLWLGFNNNLVFFDLSNFSSKKYLKTKNNTIPIFDCEKEKTLFYYTIDAGLCVLDYKNNIQKNLYDDPIFKNFLSKNKGFRFTKNIIYSDSAIWFGMSPNGMAKYDVKTKKLERFLDEKSTTEFVVLGNSNNGNLCGFSKNALHKINTKTGNQVSIPLPKNLINIVPNKILEDAQGNIWISTYGYGLWQYSSRKNKFYQYSNDSKNMNTLAYDFLLDLELDLSQNLWIGTNSKGMDKLSQMALSFGYLGSQKTSYLPALTSEFIRSIYVNEKDSMIYIGSNDKGLDVINGKDKTIQNYEFPYVKNINQEYALLSICKGNENKIWLGTHGHGLFYYENSKIHKVNFSTNKSINLTNIKKIIRLENGDLLLQSGTTLWKISGLALSQDKWKINRIDLPIEVDEFFDQNNTKYIVSNGDVYILNFEKEEVKIQKKYSVKSKILSLLDYDNETLILGTNAGLFLIDKNTNKQVILNENNGLPNHTIYGILKGNTGIIWFSTNKGLCGYNLKTKQLKAYCKNDGLQGNEFNTGAYFLTEFGTLCFGGMNGITFFNDKYIYESKNKPEIGITEINIFDKKLDTDSNINFIKKIELNYDQNTISFSFTALDFSNSTKNIYQYKLENIDTNWVNSGTVHFVRFASLNPGKYTFLVRAKSEKSSWGKTKTISIVVHPPFWKEWWFKTLISLIIISLIIMFVKYFSQKKLKEKLREIEIRDKLQTERSRIARELHDNVGSQLTYIIMNIDDIDKKLENNTEQTIKKKLSKLSGFTRDTMQELRETIWTMNMEIITLFELKERIEIFLQRHFSNNENIKWSMDWDVNLDRKLLPQQSLNLVRIIQEATNNMLKYSQALNFSIDVFEEENNGIKIVIKDDGIGFDTTITDRGFGLSNMKHRTQEIGGQFILKTHKDLGTEIILTVSI